jgi:hypothetical protein
MEQLDLALNQLIQRLENSADFEADLKSIRSSYPFNRYEYIISKLFANGKISWEEYLDIRNEYLDRNLYLYVFEMASRTFGDTWGLSQIRGIDPDFKRPSKQRDASYSGEYDLSLEWKDKNGDNHYIKIEVKASKATDEKRNEEAPTIKALPSDSNKPFKMNFQQQKPSCCDVFIWIAVYRDSIKYWVINSNAIQTNKFFGPQHRNAATAERAKDYDKTSIYEGQIFVTDKNISRFDSYLSSPKTLQADVIKQYQLQKGIG